MQLNISITRRARSRTPGGLLNEQVLVIQRYARGHRPLGNIALPGYWGDTASDISRQFAPGRSDAIDRAPFLSRRGEHRELSIDPF